MADNDCFLVAAFDFGTTYSGYAFSFRDRPLSIKTNSGWNAGSQRLISQKTPTCVLVNPEKEFDSFGFDAENKFADLAEDDRHKEWLLFRHFKMSLHKSQDFSMDITVDDINGRAMSALTIFSMSMRYLREHLLNAINSQTNGVLETDIKYVITVPAIWSDMAKYFTREAAIMAGFDTKRLQLALEPEAASIWCQTDSDEGKAAVSGFETKYAVVDLGGGTADITVHEINKDKTLKEIHKASGGPWGGIYVDGNFLDWMTDLFSENTMQRFKEEQMADYFDLLRDFETKKRNVNCEEESKITFRLAASLMKIYEEEIKDDLQEKISNAGLNEQVRFTGDKLRVDVSIVKSWFDKPINNLISHLQEIFHEKSMKTVSTVLLVGGFGESQLVQKKMQEQLKTKRILTPHEAGLSVVKGAVVFGQTPKKISSRVVLHTYGFKVHVAFNKSKHARNKMVVLNGEERIYIFKAINSAGENMDVGESKIMKNMQPNKLDRTVVQIYSSDKSAVEYVTDDGCKELGSLHVVHPDGKTLADKKFDLIFIFGETELIVKARMQKTGREYITNVNWPQKSETKSQ
ncbi:heat shock 70 kDa protein 12A-like [Mercenaria mercenaria]|uniref:heat shock 70 kDa protein 12A-like n=1 Tax=Mercenaria mercenaria TaxID=6596 RepID=UPI00234E386B|nr:heat shock 70 kDa protein 12A-like [Mercenaria mercenaria]